MPVKNDKDLKNQLTSKEARSKKLDETLAKLTASKSSAKKSGVSDDALKTEVREEKAFAIESKAGLKKLRISAPAEGKEVSEEQSPSIAMPEIRAQKFSSDTDQAKLSGEDLSNLYEAKPVGRSIGYMVATASGLFLTVGGSICTTTPHLRRVFSRDFGASRIVVDGDCLYTAWI